MLLEPTEKCTDLWEAWIDLQYPGKNETATLFVVADVTVNNSLLEPKLVKAANKQGESGELALEITPNILYEEGLVTEVFYSEDLQRMDQYSFISIYAGSELIARIENIELLY